MPFFALFMSPAQAETIEEILSKVIQTNPEILAAKAKLKATEELMMQANAGYYPTISGDIDVGKSYVDRESAFFSATESKVPASGTINMIQPIYEGGKTRHSVREAKNKIMAEKYNLHDKKQTILFDAMVAYLQILKKRATLEMRKESEIIANKSFEAINLEYKLGRVTSVELLTAQAMQAKRKASTISAETDLKSSNATFVKIFGESPSNLQLLKKLPKLPLNIKEAMATAEKNNPRIMKEIYEQKAAENAISIAKSDLFPNLKLEGELSKSRDKASKASKRESAEIFAKLSIPLYEGGKTTSLIREAKQNANQKSIGLQKTRREILEQLISHWEKLKSLKAEIHYNNLQIKANALSFEGAKKENSLGIRSILDVYKIEQDLIESKIEKIEKEDEKIKEHLKILLLTGQITPKSFLVSSK